MKIGGAGGGEVGGLCCGAAKGRPPMKRRLLRPLVMSGRAILLEQRVCAIAKEQEDMGTMRRNGLGLKEEEQEQEQEQGVECVAVAS